MPTLPTFTAQRGELPISGGRRAQALDYSGTIGAGRAIIQTAEAALTHQEDEESRKALIASSEIRAKYARALDQAATDGSDTSVLKERMQDELSKVGDDFQTRRGQQSLALYTSNTELMFDEQSNKIRITRAAANARLEGAKFLNSASATINSNPLYLAAAERDADDFAQTLTDISPEMKKEIAVGLRRELNMTAAIASARIDPHGTKHRLDAGEWDLSSEQRQTALNKADTEIRALRADEQYQRALAEYNEREVDDKARDKHFAAIMSGSATRRAIMDDADLRPQTREHLIVFMEHRAKEVTTQEKKSDPVTLRNLWLRIHMPDDAPGKIFNGDAIFDAVQRGALNTTDANNLNTLVANQKDENNRSVGQRLALVSSTMARAIAADPQFIQQPALVAEIQNDYNARVLEKMAQLRKDGKDPSVVFQMEGKDSVVTREFIQGSIDAARERQRAAMPKLPVINTQAEYDALEPGTAYVDSSGKRGVKKGAKKASAAPVSAPAEAPLLVSP